jgi:hypothetical protein
MDKVFNIMAKTKEAILLLALQPGQPGIVDEADKCQSNNPDLFIRGAVTDPKVVQEYNTILFHRSPSLSLPMKRSAGFSAFTIIISLKIK